MGHARPIISDSSTWQSTSGMERALAMTDAGQVHCGGRSHVAGRNTEQGCNSGRLSNSVDFVSRY